MMNSSVSIHEKLSQEDDYYIAQFFQLNATILEKQLAIKEFYSFLKWNAQSNYLTHSQLQKLWVKLIKKYKIKFDEWQNESNSTSIHSYLICDSGDGLQSLIRFYQDRKLTQWAENAFSYGLNELVSKKNMQRLEIYFLTTVICNEGDKSYNSNIEFASYFERDALNKTKEIYSAFNNYCIRNEYSNALKLHRLLSAYNPQFNVKSKKTPLFYKELDCFINEMASLSNV